ncbi:porin [Methylophaga sulfidovorans]|uniref:Short chain amide porin n=1 Tax=Methylophaga sulfidovorans TaxID=45496 RepID=A0A1I4A3F7_9GAMM|nr:porin [Methylophaga sulfidovorans]SFK50863.1 short chain amide porin [Methylophaga sulfidovorans]
MKMKLNSLTYAVALASSALMAPSVSQAAGTITFGEDQYVSVGFGMRGSYTSAEDGADDGGRSNDFNLDSARLYVSGSLNKYIKGMFNTEMNSDESMKIIDAAGIFQFTPDVAIWAGRFLSPSSRANMAGPYYTSGDGYWQNIAARYGWNGGTIGRDEGVALVGTTLDQRLAYSFGAFEADKIFYYSLGEGAATKTAFNEGDAAVKGLKASDDLMYAGRLQYSFWDKEPGYYGTGNYLGQKDIFTIGIFGRSKQDGAISTTEVGDYSQYGADLLIEKKLAAGAVSFEAAYYDYDTDDVFKSEQGDAYAVGAGYIFNQKVGWGQFMPFVHYQDFDADNKVETKRTVDSTIK